jgi:hypothetical protein
LGVSPLSVYREGSRRGGYTGQGEENKRRGYKPASILVQAAVGKAEIPCFIYTKQYVARRSGTRDRLRLATSLSYSLYDRLV